MGLEKVYTAMLPCLVKDFFRACCCCRLDCHFLWTTFECGTDFAGFISGGTRSASSVGKDALRSVLLVTA